MFKTKPLSLMRRAMEESEIDVYLLPMADSFQNEFVLPHENRIKWLSEFTGSAGFLVITKEMAALFVDGRYEIQAVREVSPKDFSIHPLSYDDIRSFIQQNLPAGGRVGFNPWIFTPSLIRQFKSFCEEGGYFLLACSDDPCDRAWKKSRPVPSKSAYVRHELKFSGKSHQDKIKEIAYFLKQGAYHELFLGAGDSLSWLLNLRGADLNYTPSINGYAFVNQEGLVNYYSPWPSKFTPDIIEHLGAQFLLHPLSDLDAHLKERKGKIILLDPRTSPFHIKHLLESEGGTIIEGEDPCLLPKAIKNETEVEGARRAHVKDGVALVKFFCWLDQEAPKGKLDEMMAANALLGFRKEEDSFVSPSFETISAVDENAALPHYRSTPTTNKRLRRGSLYLVDSGGQYPEGTTDVTRTVAIGDLATPEQKDSYTRVLKGHLALSKAMFPEETSGGQIDALARSPLWEVGKDFNHGTGHGVGSFLNVHEGPQRISKRGGDPALQPGMILSIEPGYYETDQYGIRIENLAVVSEGFRNNQGISFFAFDPLTLCPYDARLIVKELLSLEERSYINEYHAWVCEALSPLLEEGPRRWLQRATAPI